MVGWYLPVRVVGEKALTRAGVRVMVRMRRVAVGRSAGAYAQAVGVRSRKEWLIQAMDRRKLVGITGRLVHAEFKVCDKRAHQHRQMCSKGCIIFEYALCVPVVCPMPMVKVLVEPAKGEMEPGRGH